ncbi:chymotrypsin-like [Cylas formicarius]|uniref:chymotrypsin-like n=1 Tax=Cylas formicarius TaxID=197179 RepID=UPI002958963C|nr:chymotrypsin-like [Cylas formicarius]
MKFFLVSFVVYSNWIFCFSGENFINSPSPDIVNGTNSSLNSRPYHVLLTFNSDRAYGGWACQGALISNNYVLTAANCAYDASRINITLGLNDVNNSTGSVVMSTTDAGVTFHPKYVRNIYDNLALIQLPQSVTSSSTIQAIKLPASSSSTNMFENVTGVASGWGYTDGDIYNSTPGTLKETQQQVMNYLVCEDTIGIFIEDGILCTTGIDGALCVEDEGAPLVIDGALIGILASASGNCTNESPSIFIKIPLYLDWLGENTDANITAN